MTATARRAELLARLQDTLRKVGAQSVLMTGTVAGLVGLNATDLKCLDLLSLSGATTAGGLARHTGLTTGAMTAVIDRLERAGYVRRHRDPADRRRVLVEALPARVRQIEPLYRRLAAATTRLHDGFDDRQLQVVLDYLSAALDLVGEHLAWLQTQSPVRRPASGRARPPRGRRASAAPSREKPGALPRAAGRPRS